MQCPLCHLENPRTAQRCDCGFRFEEARSEDGRVIVGRSVIPETVIRKQNENMIIIGGALVCVGMLVAVAAAFFYDPSVSSESGRVLNMGLLQNREIAITGGMQLSILGALLMIYGK